MIKKTNAQLASNDGIAVVFLNYKYTKLDLITKIYQQCRDYSDYVIPSACVEMHSEILD